MSVLNCDFGQTELTETVVGCTGSDVTVQGCYMQGIQVGDNNHSSGQYNKLVRWHYIITIVRQVGQVEHLTSQAVGVSSKSVARIENNYIYKTGTGVSVLNSDVTCSR